jgi:hypothetical protein
VADALGLAEVSNLPVTEFARPARAANKNQEKVQEESYMKAKKNTAAWLRELAALAAFSVLCIAAKAQAASQPKMMTNPDQVNQPLQQDVSVPLREMPLARALRVEQHAVLHPKADGSRATAPGLVAPNPSPEAPASFVTGPLISATIGLNFDGIDQASDLASGPDSTSCDNITGATVSPPDTNAAVGDTQVVEWVNTCYAVFDKTTGNLVAGPYPGNQFWHGFGGLCEQHNDGDPTIKWDSLAHRWVAFQNVFESPYATCIAVSTTADATGSYFRYQFAQPAFPDYPKVGVMPNAYYQTQNLFTTISGSSTLKFEGVNVCAYNRAALLAGPATTNTKGGKGKQTTTAMQICFWDSSLGTLFDDSLLPADLDSPSHPPAAGEPEVFVGSIDNQFFFAQNAIYQYLMTADFAHPSRSTLVGTNGSMPVTVPTYNAAVSLFGTLAIEEPPASDGSPSAPLDTLGDRLMYRLAYFNDGTTQYWLANHTALNMTDGTLMERWYQFSSPEGSASLSLLQAGQSPADGESRWMGSIAMDKTSNIALGYSRTSANTGDYASIYLAGQAAGEPAGTTDAETLVFQGQDAATQVSRWGDYTSMVLDPVDQCTFWYANEYLPVGSLNLLGVFESTGLVWRTRIASFKFPNCN